MNQKAAPSGSDDDELSQSAPSQKPRTTSRATSSTLSAAAKTRPVGKTVANTRSTTKANAEAKKDGPTATITTNVNAPAKKKILVKKKVTFADHEPGVDKENLPIPRNDEVKGANEHQAKESPPKTESMPPPKLPEQNEENKKDSTPADNEATQHDDKKEPLSEKKTMQLTDTSTPRRPGHFYNIEDDSEDELEMLFRRSPSRPVLHKTFDSPAVGDNSVELQQGPESENQPLKAAENDDRDWFSVPPSSRKIKDLISPGTIHLSSPARRLPSAPPIETFKGTPRRVRPLTRAASAEVKVTNNSPLKASPIKALLKGHTQESVETSQKTNSPLKKSPTKVHIGKPSSSYQINFTNGTPSKDASSMLLHTPARRPPSSAKLDLYHDHFNTLTPIPFKLERVDEHESASKSGGHMNEDDDIESTMKNEAASAPVTRFSSGSPAAENEQSGLNEASLHPVTEEREGSSPVNAAKAQEPEKRASGIEAEQSIPDQNDPEFPEKHSDSEDAKHRSVSPASPDSAVKKSSHEDNRQTSDPRESSPASEMVHHDGLNQDSVFTTDSSPAKQDLLVPEFRRDTISLNPMSEVVGVGDREGAHNTGFSPLVQKLHEWDVLQESPEQKSADIANSSHIQSPLLSEKGQKGEPPVQMQHPNLEGQQTVNEFDPASLHEDESDNSGPMSSPFKEQVTHDLTGQPNEHNDSAEANDNDNDDEDYSSDPFAISSPVGKSPSPTKPISSNASPVEDRNSQIDTSITSDKPLAESSSPIRQDSVERDVTPSPSPSTTLHTEYDHTLQSIERSRLSQTGVSPFAGSVHWNSSPSRASNMASPLRDAAIMQTENSDQGADADAGSDAGDNDHDDDDTLPESSKESLLFSRTSLGDTRITPFPDESDVSVVKKNAPLESPMKFAESASSPFIPVPKTRDSVTPRYGDHSDSSLNEENETEEKGATRHGFDTIAEETDDGDDDHNDKGDFDDQDEGQTPRPLPSIPLNLQLPRNEDDQTSIPSPVFKNSPGKAAPVTPVRPAAIYPRIIRSVSAVPLRDPEEKDPILKQSGHKRRRPQSLNAMDDHQTQKVPVRFSDSDDDDDDDDDDDSEGPRKRSRRSSTLSATRPPTPARKSLNSSFGRNRPSHVHSPPRRPVQNFTTGSSDILRGAIVYTDIHTCEGEDANAIFVELLTRMGAKCVKTWSWNPQANVSSTGNDQNLTPGGSRMRPSRSKIDITHVVYKDGGVRTLEKVREANGLVQCVGVAWVLDCEREGKWLNEDGYIVDSSIIPRGGKKRRKSMEPKRMSNVGGTLMDASGRTDENEELPQLSPNPLSMTRRRRSSRRDSMEWVRNNQRNEDDDDDDNDGNDGHDRENHDVKGEQAGVFADNAVASKENSPTTPTNQTFDHGIANGNSPFTPSNSSYPNKEILQKTCPPKLQNRGLSEGPPSLENPNGESGGSRGAAITQAMKLQLDMAKRKSLTWKPKVGSPLARF